MVIRCCANCFGDRVLRNQIIPLKSDSTGVFSFCRSDDVELVQPSHLNDEFEMLVNSYGANPDGASLVEWLKKDWNLFDNDVFTDADCENLLQEILNDRNTVKARFSP